MLGAVGDRTGEVGVRSLFVRCGERGGEGLDELGGGAVVEADAPGRRRERVFVGVDAPQAVVFAFGQVAEADPPVGGMNVRVAEVVVLEVPAQGEQGLEGGVTDPGGAREVARGDVDVPVDVVARVGFGAHRAAFVVRVISPAAVSRRSSTWAVSRPVTM